MNTLLESQNLISIASVIFIVFAIHLHVRKMQKLQQYYRHTNELANSYVELQNNCELLEQLQKAHINKAKAIVHDLRGPISGIISASQLLQIACEKGSEDEKLLTLIEDSGTSAALLVNELLSSETQLQLAKERSDLYEILNACTHLLNFQAAEKSQKITLQGNPIQLFVNKEKIRRVIINLVSNAIKFSFENSNINIGLNQVNNEVVISVEDQGVGIPSIISQDIFNNSSNKQRLGTANEESFGLGLSISKQIVEEHGGRIWFENNKSSGSTFFFALPLTN
ncbi:HAMP domain-containing sensor histidine kinase [Pedobacter aquatilis]|uniref:sensor histidine kinase n=1 Tax=Pedobacter aquatilis TaxID=351343 RepID=UPI00292E9484|nr:HAMP domain-containing sensor histidine kinase [Pedobacter aquatilis]